MYIDTDMGHILPQHEWTCTKQNLKCQETGTHGDTIKKMCKSVQPEHDHG